MSLTKVSYSMISGAPANVLDFGAVGDGVTDDTVAIQAALNSGAGVIFFPFRTYKIAGGATPTATTLIVPSTVYELRGEGGFRTPTQLNFTGTNNAGTAFDIQSTNIRSVSNLFFNTSASNGNFTNIISVAADTHFCNWTNVTTNGGATTHWNFGNTCFVQCFVNCGAWGTDWLLQTGIKIGAVGNAFDFHSCHFVHCGIGAWLLGDSIELVNFYGGDIASNSKCGVHIGSDSGLSTGIEGVNFFGVYFEDQPIHIIQKTANFKGLQIYGCRTSELPWSALVDVQATTYSINISGGVYNRAAGGTGYLINANGNTVVDAFIDSPYLFSVTPYTNVGANQIWYRTNRIGGSPGQTSYETQGINAQKDFNTTYSYANKRIVTTLANNANPVIHDVGFGSVYDAVAPGAGGSLWSGNTWPQGSICWNSSATVGQPQGWMCTVAGTPGTWVSMGNL
jgi:hypothetical protein